MKLKCITSLDQNDANFHLDREKKVIFSHAYRGSSRSLQGVTHSSKTAWFQQLNWRIRERGCDDSSSYMYLQRLKIRSNLMGHHEPLK